MPSIESNQHLLAAAAAAEDKKAEEIRILALDPSESGLADYFLICNGTNDRQNVAIADEIELRLKREFNLYANSVEGRRQSEWILMDYVDFIVHIFSPEKRAFYGLERLRKSATTLSVEDIDAEIRNQIAATRRAAPRKTAAKKDAAPKAVKASAKKTPPAAAKSAKKLTKTAVKKEAGKTSAKSQAKSPAKSSAPKKTSAKKAPAKKSSKA